MYSFKIEHIINLKIIIHTKYMYDIQWQREFI